MITSGISITAARKAVETAPTERRELLQLYADFLDYAFIVRRLDGQEECHSTGLVASWECCPDHRILLQAQKELDRRGEAIRTDNSEDVFSDAWWNLQGIRHTYNAVITV